MGSPTVSPTTAAPTYSPLTNDNIFLVMYAWVTDKENNQNNVEDVFGPIEQWDVSAVTSMWNSEYGIGLFQEKSGFNSNISTWNVGKVTNMVTMFKGSSFNNNIASWKIDKVTAMNNMFHSSTFEQNLCDWLLNPNFPSKIDTNDMFFNSGCEVKSDPSQTNVCQYCNN